MNQNLYIMKEELNQMHFQSHLFSPPYELNCVYPMVCENFPDTLLSDVLYICKASSLPAFCDFYCHIRFICIGIPDKIWFSSQSDFLYTTEAVDIFTLVNDIYAIYNKYNKWEEMLQDIIDQRIPLVELAKRSLNILNKPIYVQTSAFYVLFYYHPTYKNESAEYKKYKNDFYVKDNATLSADEINILITDAEYNNAITSTQPTIYSGKLYGFRSLYYNIFENDTSIARVLFDEMVNPITDKDYALIKVLGYYIKKGIKNENIYIFNRPTDLDDILKNFLSHKLIPEERISSVLQHFQWNTNDTYICTILKMRTKDDTLVALGTIALDLASIFNNDCYTIFNDHIVFISNLTKTGKTKKTLLVKILPILRDNLLTAALSEPYYDFKNLYYYYTQALFTETYGENEDPTKWYYHAKDYNIEYILQKCKHKNIPSVFVPEGLHILIEHDTKKQTDYVNTLKVYLENERNIAETIRITYMHRNTFLYRIKRIQEILQMDLDDPDVRMSLLFAFKFLN